MAKKSKSTTKNAQHMSTSEAVKIRPKKRLNTMTTQPTKIQKVEEKENVPIVLRPLPLANLDELYKIWDADRRIPTVESRREWAAARNVAPQDVHRFFSRQKALVKKARKGLPKGTYTLPIGTPPVIKQEEEAPRSILRRKAVLLNVKTEKLETPLNSDDSYVPTSDTLVASPQQEQKNVIQKAGNSSPLPPTSPPPPSSLTPEPSILLFSPSLPHRPRPTENNSEHTWCYQGRASSPETSLACALCTPGSFSTTHHMHAHPSSDSLFMELSALPFIYRSPDLMRRRSAVPDSTQWFFDLHFDLNQGQGPHAK
ncbi:hypothetical protein C0995_001748 [Termitomyces sp. Mi166|nr:hypothetical protein C0995_001748 [Termitomyces sp. Mi166\